MLFLNQFETDLKKKSTDMLLKPGDLLNTASKRDLFAEQRIGTEETVGYIDKFIKTLHDIQNKTGLSDKKLRHKIAKTCQENETRPDGEKSSAYDAIKEDSQSLSHYLTKISSTHGTYNDRMHKALATLVNRDSTKKVLCEKDREDIKQSDSDIIKEEVAAKKDLSNLLKQQRVSNGLSQTPSSTTAVRSMTTTLSPTSQNTPTL